MKTIAKQFIGFSILSIILGLITVSVVWTNYAVFMLFGLSFCISTTIALISLGLWKDKWVINV
jgi:hypothetical protein